MAESFLIFDVPPVKAQDGDKYQPGAPQGLPGVPDTKLVHIIRAGRTCADRVDVARIGRDGTPTADFTVTEDAATARKAAQDGKLVIHLQSTC